jgi:hypothetical protein
MATKLWLAQNKERMQAHQRAYYLRNTALVKARAGERTRQLRQWFKDYKATLSCIRCGENHPACLEFHHPDPAKKELEPSRLVQQKGWSRGRILVELQKCHVLCANCHRKTHHLAGAESGST